MKYRISTDPFFDKQPKKDFVTYLTQPMHITAPSHWNISRSMKENEAYLLNATLIAEFPDSEKLLETINTDFRQFLKFCGGQSGAYKIRTVKKETECFEAYEINVTENECLVCANDTEGIRRALIFLEDEMCRNGGPFLPLGVIKRKPHVKSRISRSFFAPATHYGESEELADDCDYYPENYLNRLMHDGVNGLWIFVHFKTLLPSAIVPEYGENYRKLIQKLNKIVDRCMKYGIKIYALGTEPASTFQNEVLHNHPEMLGASFLPDNSAKAVCVSKESGVAYIKEAITNLFTLSPRLSGLITISVGESVASCAAVEEHGDDIFCPHCKALGLDKPLALVKYEEIISSTLKNIKPDAEFISWTYAHRGWSADMVKKYLTFRSRDTILMENFEDWGEVTQLGKPHTARDYWLSYSGPGELFRMASEASVVNKTPLYAKIQVCCSHEIASVPYIPAPGKLYDKFKYMYENGIGGALFCWYFGNYPSLMNKAACELSFFDFSQDKVDFLDYIARIFWGNESKIITKAWKIFEEAYSNFPVNVAFTWFGPMTDGIVWPLHLEPIDMPVSSNWLLQDMVGGDRIGECIAMGHTLPDAISLCEKMASEFETGLSLLESANIDDPNRKEQLSVARAIAILFRSGTNILNFYNLRNQLGYENSYDKNKILLKMRQIVCHEKELSQRMMLLCESDRRLGYHSEAEGYKFFPEKLAWRINMLDDLLDDEFPRVEHRLLEGNAPLPFYCGLVTDSKKYQITDTIIENAEWDYFVSPNGDAQKNTAIRIAEDDNSYIFQIKNASDKLIIKPEFTFFQPYAPIVIDEIGNITFPGSSFMHKSAKELEQKKWNIDVNGDTITIKILKRDFALLEKQPFRMSIQAGDVQWYKDDRIYSRLIYGKICPDSYVFILPKKL